MGGFRELASCLLASAPVGAASVVLDEPDLMLLVVALCPAGGVFTALQSFVKERESGALPALLGSPATAGEIVLGKTIGCFLIGLVMYWAAVLGALAGWKVALATRGAPWAGDFELAFSLALAVAMTPVVLAVAGVTVGVCWRAKTSRDAAFWSVAAAGVAAGSAIPLRAVAALLGTCVMLASAWAAAVLIAGLVLHHAGRARPERVLYGHACRGS